ncbi:MAG TPA: thioether cross-link-forming SCIFF peptide maturase [Clostridiaceae bacterium]
MSLIHKFTQDGEYYALDVNSGAVHIIDELIFDLLREDSALSFDEAKLLDKYSDEELNEGISEINELINAKMLYSREDYQEAALAHDSESYIKALCLNIAHDCNLKCTYCFADEGEYKGKREIMTPFIGKKAIDFVIEHSGPRRNIEVDLFGGEPLLAFDTVKEIVKYAREKEKLHNKNIRFTITTNGTLLTDEIIDYIDKNMGNVVLSIDGREKVNDAVRVRKDGSGTYKDIIVKITKMVAKRDKSKQYYLRGTFTSKNLDFSEDVLALANLGFKEISIEPVVLPKGNPLALKEEYLPEIFKQYDIIYSELLERNKNGDSFKFYHFNIDLKGGPCIYKRISGCGAGHEYVSITPNGDIYPCHQFTGDQKFKMGNILEEGFATDMSKKFKEAHIYNKPKCLECWARFYCSGGCQANNYNFNGDINIPYELGCSMQKKRIECAIALKSQIDF